MAEFASKGVAGSALGLGIAEIVVPNSACCPGWGGVEVTPVTKTTTGAGS